MADDGGPMNGPADQKALLRGVSVGVRPAYSRPEGIIPVEQAGARPCASTVRERRCVVMSGRPGLNPRAKFGEAPLRGLYMDA